MPKQYIVDLPEASTTNIPLALRRSPSPTLDIPYLKYNFIDKEPIIELRQP